MPVSLHNTGKASFDDIYERADPSDYYRRMSELDYCIPDVAKPHFRRLIDDYRTATGVAPTVLDLGCSYGVNAAVLRLDTTVGALAEHYRCGDTAARADRDRAWLAAADSMPDVRFLGMDASGPALGYAASTGLLAGIVHADLETAAPTESQRRILAGADLVISTGCVGYITERTLARVAAADGHRLPWMAHFVLRMFDFAPIELCLRQLGYRTERLPGTFRQRRFASEAEQAQIVSTLSANGIDPSGHEADGWLHAELFVSVPISTPTPTPTPTPTAEDRQ
ncbi:class I SAM-dependent methyltransferase [Nocardia sp. alder85J]|uniref:class I SAM-dependent methyltransferase n=1 Tax=Nocardia sp. alder85J TaxID=2862949 RepID=UPI001CD6257D|nr:class I SAM-dependent methyltransferase [Nocardia sp. alder85J]MCX4092757.1 class I SAM-dependent methyltransferase [Nocardia sp. alder85J]